MCGLGVLYVPVGRKEVGVMVVTVFYWLYCFYRGLLLHILFRLSVLLGIHDPAVSLRLGQDIIRKIGCFILRAEYIIPADNFDTWSSGELSYRFFCMMHWFPVLLSLVR